MSENENTPEPPARLPTATPLGGIGNNLTVACPCGKIVAAPTLFRAKCDGGRRFQAVGKDVSHLDVWEQDNDQKVASYRVPRVADLQPRAR